KGLSDSALRLFLSLDEAAQANPSYKTTIPVLAESARIPVADVVPAQAELADRGLIERDKTKIVRVGSTACSLRFTADRDKEVESLRIEVEELRHRLKDALSGNASGLADTLSPSHASVIHAAEDV